MRESKRDGDVEQMRNSSDEARRMRAIPEPLRETGVEA